MFKGFKSWLADNRNFVFSRYTKDSEKTQEPEKSLIELSPEVRKKLVEDTENLSSNPADKKAIVDALDEAFERWQANPNNNNNSIVILSSPVAAVSRILSETLEDWTKQKQIPMKLLPLQARPVAAEKIKSKLEHYLKQQQPEDDEPEEQSEVIAIPNLSWCFLRSLEGLEGIEYLQSLLCDGSKNRFWIIGGGEVGWEYLNSVCNLEAYCGKVMTLPEIEPEEFQDWLEPIIKNLDITFDKPGIDKRLLEGDKSNKTNYFNRLADISEGISTVAVQAFLKSIHHKEIDEVEDFLKDIETDVEHKLSEKVVVAQTPHLPDLADLESADQYLLYSLLLHGDITISALAESLGDEQSQVQNRVQVLRNKGVVEQQEKVIKINPIHYPKIKRELAQNNFVINRD
ncbi:winged helix-turn-helix domain-containing protein [Pleurocapsa sp. FMAR1]|uniref:winged helix-turn-helix domain-containing protein n=1 Tax=Pleurocapsa sp. FMAR1 TaxID=3040204 RepID=UPI0029C732F5|nr:winged helix-turn-helix domain-containing protein [Pleurocapsa sp. FMAR1]